jgi:hypothetical protein
MTIELIGAITLVVGLIGLFAQPNFIVYAFFASTLLGAAAALIVTSLGGTTIQPAHLLLGFLTVKLLADRDIRMRALEAASPGSPGFWLVVTVIYSTVTAFLMPRLFQGQTFAYAVRAQGGENYLAPLVPTTSNLTQSVYFIGDCVCFLVLAGWGASESGRRCLGRAALMCVMLNLIFGFLDLVTYATNTAELLSFIRNSTYSILSDTGSAGFKRIVGSFVEASSFGYWTLGYFAFATTLWLHGIAARLTFALSVLSFLTLLFSTSTTAYVGLGGYLAVQFAIVTGNFLFGQIRREMVIFMVCAPFLFVIVALAISLNDVSSAYFSDLLNTFVLDKMSTSSGVERSRWNSQAIQNFLDTFGFGAGNGSVRASSFPVAVIGSLGILGAASYAMFLLTIWFRRKQVEPPVVAATQAAARSACLAWLIAATASAGFIDLGLPFFAFAALGCLDSPKVRTQLTSTRAAVSYP